MSAELTGKTALVTGASSGIGLATARAMLDACAEDPPKAFSLFAWARTQVPAAGCRVWLGDVGLL